MAGTAVIASLRVTLGLDSAEFTRGAKVADRQFKHLERKFGEMGRNMQRMGTRLSAGVTAPLAALGAAVANTARQMAQDAKNMQASARLAGEGFEEFQRQAFAARTVGIEFEKLGDIFKDTRDKIGDFMATGGGEMADFFENVAPKVGVTAEQFRGLSGRDALQLYYDTLKKANVSQEEMVFYLESIADEATGLIPLLEDGGKAFATLGEGAAIIGDDQVENFEQLRLAQEQLTEAWRKMTIAVVSSGVLDAIVGVADAAADLFRRLSQTNPEVIRFAATLGAMAAAIGPLVYSVGTLTKALAPLAAGITLVGRMAASTGTATGAATVAVAGFRGAVVSLMTSLGPWVIALGAVSAAMWLMAQRARTVSQATDEQREAAEHLRQIQDRTREATERLTYARGKEREQILANIRALRAEAQEYLRNAQAAVIATQARLQESSARFNAAREASRREGVAATGGSGFGVWGSMGAQGAQNWVAGPQMAEAARAHGEAVRNALTAAQELQRLQRALNSPAPEPMGGGGGSTAGGSSATERLRDETDELSDLLDQLFPEVERLEKFQEDMARIMAADIPETLRSEAISRLREELGGYDRDAPTPVDPIFPKFDLDDLVGKNIDRANAHFERMAEEAEEANRRVIDSFREMVYDVRWSVDNLAQGLRSGDLFDILFGLVDVLDSIGRTVAPGKGFELFGMNFGGPRAMGGPVSAGSAYLVGENGPEIFAPGRSGNIIPNHAMGAGGLNVTVTMDPSTGALGAFVTDTAGQMLAQATPALVAAGGQDGVRRMQQMQERAL